MTPRFEPTFDIHGAAPDDGDWAYIVDDYGIVYGPGWWPFHRDGKQGIDCVAPDTDFRSWSNKYLSAVARLHLFVRPQRMGAMTVAAQLGIEKALKPLAIAATLRTNCQRRVLLVYVTEQVYTARTRRR